MIDRIVDRAFVLQTAERVRAELARRLLQETELAGLEEAHAALLASISGEPATVDLQPEARKAFVPQDAVLSLLQAAMEERLRKQQPELLQTRPRADEMGGPVATMVVTTDDLDESAGDFTKLDPGWISETAIAIIGKLRRGMHSLGDGRKPPEYRLSPEARVVLVGDWGTGAWAADQVAQRIRHELDAAGSRETHVIHLGDVYYAGDEWEARERFLEHWPVHADEAHRHQSWCLTGNHDMYSGGYGYFDVILADERFRHQRADGDGMSFFRLINDDWQVLGLDSSWSESMLETGHHGRLAGRQQEWIEACLDEHPRRTVLLSHHQLLSTHGKVAGDLANRMARVMTGREIDAWFWGHEHRCMTFAPRPSLRYSACVGHGAMPQSAGDAQPEEGEWEYDVSWEDVDNDRWRLCGFAVLDFSGADVRVRYINERGETHYEEALTA